MRTRKEKKTNKKRRAIRLKVIANTIVEPEQLSYQFVVRCIVTPDKSYLFFLNIKMKMCTWKWRIFFSSKILPFHFFTQACTECMRHAVFILFQLNGFLYPQKESPTHWFFLKYHVNSLHRPQFWNSNLNTSGWIRVSPPPPSVQMLKCTKNGFYVVFRCSFSNCDRNNE